MYTFLGRCWQLAQGRRFLSHMRKNKPSEGIRSLPGSDRPRERMMRFGPASLSDSELLALLLGSGSPGVSSLHLARSILGPGKAPFRNLSAYSIKGLQRFTGIGPAKAVTVAAAMEIARRLHTETEPEAQRIRQSRDAFLQLKRRLGHLGHEEFWVICLNSANRVLCTYQLSKGGITGTLVDVRIILRKALEVQAVALILAHNHPSGNLKPSKADQQITRKVQKAARLMDIRVLDHIIINGEEYFSFADEQLL